MFHCMFLKYPLLGKDRKMMIWTDGVSAMMVMFFKKMLMSLSSEQGGDIKYLQGVQDQSTMEKL